MTRIALLSSEPVRERMAGIGIRYLELARRLPRPGVEVVLISPAPVAEVPPVPGEVRTFAADSVRELLADCDAAVAQGQLANDLVLACPELPTAIDLYDPWLVENLHYLPTLGLDPYRNDHASWVLQLSRGDFFLCASEEQRLYYRGFLTALGRVNPERLARDPDLARLIVVVPFGVPDELPPHRPCLPPRGGVASARHPLRRALRLVRPLDAARRARAPARPATGSSLGAQPQRRGDAAGAARPSRGALPRARLVGRARAGARLGRRRAPLRPAARRRRCCCSPHRPSLETRLSLRTRFLDALAAGCPVVTSEGGTVARLVRERGAGWVVPPADAAALARGARGGARRRAASASGGARRAASSPRGFAWARALAPLVRFCERAVARRDARALRVPAADGGAAGRGRLPPAPPPATRVLASDERRELRGDAARRRSSSPAGTAAATSRPASPRSPSSTTPACRGSSGCSTTARATAPPTGCGASGCRAAAARAPGREREQPRLRGRHQPARRGGRGDALVAFLNNDTRRAASGWASWSAALAAAPADVAAVSGLHRSTGRASGSTSAAASITFDGHAFQLDYRRPLAQRAAAGGGRRAAVRLRRQHAGAARPLPRRRRLRPRLLRLLRGRRSGLAAVVGRPARAGGAGRRGAPPLAAPPASCSGSTAAASSSSATPSSPSTRTTTTSCGRA